MASLKRHGLPNKLLWVVDNIKSNDLHFFVLVTLDCRVGFSSFIMRTFHQHLSITLAPAIFLPHEIYTIKCIISSCSYQIDYLEVQDWLCPHFIIIFYRVYIFLCMLDPWAKKQKPIHGPPLQIYSDGICWPCLIFLCPLIYALPYRSF